MHATTVAIDLAKDVFELAFADAHGRILERKRFYPVPRSRGVCCSIRRCGWSSVSGRVERALHAAPADDQHAVRLLPARDVRVK
jgi:transposase